MSETYLLPKQRNKSRGKKGKTWYGGIVKNGVTRWFSLKTTDPKVAMNWYNEMQASRYMPKKDKPAILKLCDAIEAYLVDVDKVRRRSTGTVYEYKKNLKLFFAWCKPKGIADINEITPQICSQYASEELSKTSGNTAKTRAIQLRSFFRWVARIHGLTMQNPFNGISIPKSKTKPREFWTVEECEKIIEAANSEEYKCWFALMAYAGLRKSEARLLKMENLEGSKISFIGKGGKAATLPISSRLKERLNIYLVLRGDYPGYLFPNLAKISFGIEREIKSAAINAGVSNADTAHYHRFRHSFASNLIRIGRSIKAVQMLMRHESVTLTLNIYGHLLPSDLEKDVEL